MIDSILKGMCDFLARASEKVAEMTEHVHDFREDIQDLNAGLEHLSAGILLLREECAKHEPPPTSPLGVWWAHDQELTQSVKLEIEVGE